MPCEGTNARNLPCGVNPKKGDRYCHIHERMYARMRALAEHRLAMINPKTMHEVQSEPKVKSEPETEVSDSSDDQSSDESVSSELNLANEMLEEQVVALKKQLSESESKIKKMSKDYNAYQTIRKYQTLFEKLCAIYMVSDNYQLNNAIKDNPIKAIPLLGDMPHLKFNSLRIERNNLCHALS